MRVVIQERGTNRFTIFNFVHIVKTLANGDVVLIMDSDTAPKIFDIQKFEITITN